MVVYDGISFPVSASPTILVATANVPYGSTDGVNRQINLNQPVGFSFRVGDSISPNAQTITATISAITSVAVYKNGVFLLNQTLLTPFSSIAKSYTLGSATGILAFNSYMQQFIMTYIPTSLPAVNTTDTYTFYATFSFTLSSTKTGGASSLTSTGAGSIVYGIIANTTTSTSSFTNMSYASGSSNSSGYAASSITTPLVIGLDWSVSNAGYIPTISSTLWTGFNQIAALYTNSAYITNSLYFKNTGSTNTISWINTDANGSASLASIFPSTTSNVMSFDAQSALTNGFRFRYNGTQVAGISATGLLSCAGVTSSAIITANAGIIITDATTNPATATTGSLVIKHNTSGGKSSIVFPSASNAGSDYGYIQYDDNRGSGGENAKLTIGTSNDTDDDIYLSASGGVYVTCNSYYSDWIRPTGNTGIYWNNWGGGWTMTDSTYMRCYGDKIVYTATSFQQGNLGGGFTVSTVTGTNSRYVSRLSVNENSNYVEMAKYNSDRTTEVGRIGLSYFNSDCRLKEYINEPIIKNVSNYIKQIEFVSFKWKERKNPDDTCELGIIAQQIESIYPDLINTYTDSDTYGDGIGTKGVNTNTFSTFMMKGIQELIIENESLKSEIQKIKEYLNIV